MTPELLILVCAALVAVPLSWALPQRWVWDGIALWTAAILALLSPKTLLWLVASSSGTVAAMRLGAFAGRPGTVGAIWAAVLVLALVASRETQDWALVGAAYFTLRNLHVLFDGWMGRIENVDLRRMLHYQLFLPVIAIGPIHRMQNFTRECTRRRFEAHALAAGAERALFGLVAAVVAGAFMMNHVEAYIHAQGRSLPNFWLDWLLSVSDWIRLYLSFAGLSSVAIGIALMMGLRIEENFQRPFLAPNLIDFWARWHITLSLWCRDYVFQPVTAITRRPALGLLAAMLAIGLWHGTSVYYVLWAIWQVIGIIGSRVLIKAAERYPALCLPTPLTALLAPLAILGWLSLARPVLTRILEFAS